MTMTNKEWREHQYYQFDPLAKEVQPALLNSVDIKKYVDKGCLLDKSTYDLERLKTASYEMRFLGELHDWQTTSGGKLKQRRRNVCEGDIVELPRNSITYLWMKEKFLLPEYIAARFNLHIRHVHKGILLGTGPLVDPGFFGSLLVPLHNLTDNDYKLKGGEGFIWIEFTKLSAHKFWWNSNSDRPHFLKSFPGTKDLDGPDLYFRKSGVLEEGGVQSAFKGALEETQSAAEAARKETGRFKTIFTWAGVVGVITIAIGVGSVIMDAISLVNQVASTQDEIHRHIQSERNERSENMDTVQNRIEDLEERVGTHRTEIESLKGQIEVMNQRRETGPDLVR